MQTELQFEDELINHLTKIGGSKQWKYESSINTTDALWDNFKKILEQRNQDKLDMPLSDEEFNQVKQKINSIRTPYEAGQFLYGINGYSEVDITLDNGKNVFLNIFDQSNIGAGNTVYQIVNQIQRPAKIAGKENRRFDVTLLINGLPIIQIEEKKANHNVMEAFNQMHQYINENQYSDIFSTVQILIGMTKDNVRYMANTTPNDFNTDFAFHWQNEKDNSAVTDWKDFSNQFLSIPMAHQMATNYIILDGNQNSKDIKVMRPYQVYATRKVINKLRFAPFDRSDKKLGYIWHTTGSGKTISSFKTAWLASRLSNVDKVVFLVDRIALTQQTAANYAAYDPDSDSNNNNGIVSDTANVGDLLRKLKNKSNGIVVTSIQKLDRLVQGKNKIPEKNIVFIVDEAHRSTSGDMFKRVMEAFPHSEWVGYTGTPRFPDRNGKSDGPTTYDIFGDLLHSYTIRQAIADKNVLGFKVDFNTTLGQDVLDNQFLPKFYKERYPKWSDEKIKEKISNMTPEDKDDEISSGVYDNNKEHVRLVVDDIFNKWQNRSSNYRYSAMLTTHVGGNKASSSMAMMYYDEIKKRNKTAKHPIKVAVTFSDDGSNGNNMVDTNLNLSRAVREYNDDFGTNYDDTTFKEYRDNVVDRIKRETRDDNYLDLVIVVDQLLTGFDDKTLNTLYVDRTLKGSNLIQAYSRTNRVQDMEHKPYGRIINYRWPETSKRLMNEALEVYSNKDSAVIQPEIDGLGLSGEGGVLQIDFQDALEETKKTVNELSDLTEGFLKISPSEEAQKATLKKIKEYNKEIASLKQYDEYDYNNPKNLLKEIGIRKDQEVRLTTTIYNEIKDEFKKRDPDFSDINFKMEHINEIRVNYDYIEELLAKLANEVNDNKIEESKKTYKQVNEMADQSDNEKYTKRVKRTANIIKSGKLDDSLVGQYPVLSKDIKKIMQGQDQISRRAEILNFRQKWGFVDADGAKNLFNNILDNHVKGNDDLDANGELGKIINAGQQLYKIDASDEKVRKLPKIKYRNKLREAVEKFADYISEEY